MKEKEMYPKVSEWLINQGYFIAYEIMTCGFCDMVACKWENRIKRKIPNMLEAIALELKVSDISNVIDQATNNLTCCSKSYAVMPKYVVSAMRDTTLDRFKDKGIGLISVGDSVLIEIESLCGKISTHVSKRAWNFKLRSDRGATRYNLPDGGNVEEI